MAEQVLATIREAVTNVGRHARATQATVLLSVAEGLCRLEVVDNGRGIDEVRRGQGGLGLVNLRRRAEKLHGEFVVEQLQGGGTSLVWQAPISR